MLLRLWLVSLSCMVIVACTSKADQNQAKPSIPDKSINKAEFPSNDITTRKRQQWHEFLKSKDARAASDLPSTVNLPPSNEDKLEDFTLRDNIKVPQISALESLEVNSYMTLTPTETTNSVGNPIYTLSLYANGELLGTYPTVTGRANTQNRNRHQEGTKAPLPDGRYEVASSVVPGTHAEVGGRFLPIEPLFPTNRSALGIHFDPSFEKSNGEDGTEGCIALVQEQDLDQVLNYVRTYQPQYLEVNI